MSNTRTLVIVEIALAIALAVVLNLLQIRLPINIAGGSINLSMLPIAIVALRRGPISGMFAGAAFGLFDLLIEPFILVPMQVVMDYPLPYLLFGFAVGLFSKSYNKSMKQRSGFTAFYFFMRSSFTIVGALVCGGLLRLASHTVSGVLFFSEYAADFFAENPGLVGAGPLDSGLNVWVYSTAYNLLYLVPSLISVGVLLLIIAPALAKAVPVRKPVTKGEPQSDDTTRQSSSARSV